jgi:O-acetylserine/cysteine efflux transporter
MPLLGVLAALVTVTLWGANFIVVKIAVSEVPPLFVAAIRFTILAVLLSPFLRVRREDLRNLAVYAVFMGVCHFATMFVAIQFIDVSTIGIVLQLGTPFMVLLAWLMLGEKFGPWRMCGMGIAFAGIVILIGFPEDDIDPKWLMVLVFAAFMWAMGTVRAKQLHGISPLSLIAWMALLAAPMIYGLSYIFESAQVELLAKASTEFWLSVAYMIIASSVIGYGLWYTLLKQYDVAVIAPYNLLVPLVSVICGVTIMGDVLTLTKLIGGLMILGGVTLITLRQLYVARWADDLIGPKV